MSVQETAVLIIRDFELKADDSSSFSDHELLEILAVRIEWLLEYRMEFLLSLMYRLDISEEKVNQALSPASNESASLALSRLVIERQKQRLETQHKYPSPDLGEEAWN